MVALTLYMLKLVYIAKLHRIEKKNMFHNENGGTFWIAKDEYPIPVHMAIYVDSSYDSPKACVKASFKHHSSGFAFWTGGGSFREINYGLTRQDYKPERLLTSDNAELIGINKVLKYVLTLAERPERLTIICDNQALVKKLNNIREVYKILGRFPISEYPQSWHKAEYDTYMHLMRSCSEVELTFQHVKGHADSHFNHIADRLAHLGKSIKSGADHPEDEILKNLANDSVSWNAEYKPHEQNGEFFLGMSKTRYEVQNGTYRYGLCLYDARNNVSHTGIFEPSGKTAKENYIRAAVESLEIISALMPKGAHVNLVIPISSIANVLHAYVSNYVIPAGLLQKNIDLFLHEHRKNIKKFGSIGIISERNISVDMPKAKDGFIKANLRAEKAVEQYSAYRSLYAFKPIKDSILHPETLT